MTFVTLVILATSVAIASLVTFDCVEYPYKGQGVIRDEMRER